MEGQLSGVHRIVTDGVPSGNAGSHLSRTTPGVPKVGDDAEPNGGSILLHEWERVFSEYPPSAGNPTHPVVRAAGIWLQIFTPTQRCITK